MALHAILASIAAIVGDLRCAIHEHFVEQHASEGYSSASAWWRPRSRWRR